MKCPKCGYENKADAEVCGLCRSVKFVRSGGAAPGGAPKPLAGATGAPAARGTPAPPPAAQVAPTVRGQLVPASRPAASPAPAAPPAATGGKKHLLVRVGAPSIEIVPDQPFTFGRHATCSLMIPSNRVSRVHAEISWEGGRPVISDKGSSNGTFVSGKQIKAHPLSDGDEIEVGPFLCVYRFGEPEASAADNVESQTMSAESNLLAGQIDANGLSEVVQGLEFNKKTGTLAAFSRNGDGWLTVENGVPLCAEAGDQKDEEAVIALLLMKHGRFTFTPEVRERERRIKRTLTGLLLEWGRRADEAERAGSGG